MIGILSLLVYILISVGAVANAQRNNTELQVLNGVAVLSGETIKGKVVFSEIKGSPIIIKVSLSGLIPGSHGFHIHQFGNLTNGCMSAGGHYNPLNKTHGAPTDDERHVGDLPNLVADEDGNVELTFEDSQVCLFGDFSIIGRAVIVHADMDDLGIGGHHDSHTTGHAGGRVACGVIGIA